MKCSSTACAVGLFAGLALAAPAPTLVERQQSSICGEYAIETTGSYTLFDNTWGQADASSGSQCSTLGALSDNSVSWSTSWTWAQASGSNDVISYANVEGAVNEVQLSTISSLATTWDWTYSAGSDIVADVSYDLFTSATAGGTQEYEIMIWLAALGGTIPITSTGSPVSTTTIAGISWSLYTGPNTATNTEVYSFVASSTTNSFSGDLMDFFAYLQDQNLISYDQYLITVGAGTEAFTGSGCVFDVSEYSLSPAYGGASSDAATTSSSAAASATSAASSDTAVASSAASSTAAASTTAVAPSTTAVASTTAAAASTTAAASSAAASSATASTSTSRGWGGNRGSHHGGHGRRQGA